jgi:phosphoglycerate dehydrogenase-like enzyme
VSGGPAQLCLLCTDHVADRYADRIATAAPDIELVTLIGDDPIAESDLARVDIAFFSGDAFPYRVAHLMGAITRAPNLRWLHTASAGIDHPVFGQLRDRGVRITTSSGAAAAPIARTVMLYLLGLSRDIHGLLRDQAAHVWAFRPYEDVDGKTIGVVGMGPIAREVIRMAAALGMRPIGMRREVIGDEPCETWALDRLSELATVADALIVALPSTDDTRGIISASVIAAMRPSAVIVNVGRGDLVDEPALIDALASGRLRGAGLDVFVTEPLPDDSPLWDLPNVIITPHSSATTTATFEGAAEIFLANLGRFVHSEPLHNER